MNTSLWAYPIALLIFVVIDLAWLLGPGRSTYVSEIGFLMRANPNLVAALAFYMLYAGGLVFFAVSGAVQAENAQQALWQGALFGLMAYATYDLTSLAVISGFTTKIAVIDMVWGSILSGGVAWLTTKILLVFSS